jgi:HEAT repeat protein
LAVALRNDKKNEVRVAAAKALGMIGDEQAIRFLNERLKTEREDEVKRAIRDALKAAAR